MVFYSTLIRKRMKKTLLFFCAFLIIGITACTKTEYVQPPEAENPNRAYVLALEPNKWQRESNAKIYYDIPLRDLTEYYMLQGGVAVALSFDEEDSYEILPTTSEGIAYSVNYGIGWVTIIADDPLADDGVTTNFPEADIYAKIILSTTDYVNYQGIFNSPGSNTMFKNLPTD